MRSEPFSKNCEKMRKSYKKCENLANLDPWLIVNYFEHKLLQFSCTYNSRVWSIVPAASCFWPSLESLLLNLGQFLKAERKTCHRFDLTNASHREAAPSIDSWLLQLVSTSPDNLLFFASFVLRFFFNWSRFWFFINPRSISVALNLLKLNQKWWFSVVFEGQ